jgi:hypothetical protein
MLLSLAALATAPPARADGAPVAPSASLALPIIRRMAEDELRLLVHALPTAAQRRIPGVYVAFDRTTTEVDALAACDDDGDYAIVLSDPLLLTLDFVAQAAATDATFHTHKLDEYAAFVAREQRRGKRFLPPAPGFFDQEQASDASKLEVERALFADVIAAVLAHELARITLGELTCSAPTATHEEADDVWTAAEHAQALARAHTLYSPASAVTADREGSKTLLESGHSEEGYVAWLSFLDTIERAPAAADRRDLIPPAYLVTHPHAGPRRDAFRVIAADWRAERKVPHA